MATQIVGYKPPPGSSERTKVVRLKVSTINVPKLGQCSQL